MQTAALDAYIQSRKMRFAGAPVTLAKILKMWQLPHDGGTTLGDAAVEGVARYCKMTVGELHAAVDAMTPPVAQRAPEPPKPAPVPLATFATVTIPPVAPPAPAPEPEPEPVQPPITIEASKPAPDPTAVIPQDQLGELVAASRRSSPVIEAPDAALAEEDDDDVDISFDEVEATPVPELVSSSTSDSAKAPSAKSGKSKKSRKKKS